MPLKKILYAEDDLDIQEITILVLQLIGGVEVTAYNDGFQALSHVQAVKPDLIMLDVMMPVMDGPTTLAHLRADPETAYIPVVFFTARALPEDIAHYTALGALGVIGKPIDATSLPQRIKELWELHEQNLGQSE